MTLSLPTLLRLAALVLLLAFITEPQWFEPVFKPLTENNAPAIYDRGSLLSLTLSHLRTVAVATVAATVLALRARHTGHPAVRRRVSAAVAQSGEYRPDLSARRRSRAGRAGGRLRREADIDRLVSLRAAADLRERADRPTTLPAAAVEAAKGVGMTGWQRLTKVELPLALPLILAGIRLSVVISLATATVGSTVAAKTLGEVIIAGLLSNNLAFVLQGGLIVAVLAVLIYDAFGVLERFAARRTGRLAV